MLLLVCWLPCPPLLFTELLFGVFFILTNWSFLSFVFFFSSIYFSLSLVLLVRFFKHSSVCLVALNILLILLRHHVLQPFNKAVC